MIALEACVPLLMSLAVLAGEATPAPPRAANDLPSSKALGSANQ